MRISHDIYGTGTVQSITLENGEKEAFIMFDSKDVIKVRPLRSPSPFFQPHTSQLSPNHHRHWVSLHL